MEGSHPSVIHKALREARPHVAQGSMKASAAWYREIERQHRKLNPEQLQERGKTKPEPDDRQVEMSFVEASR